jgi:surfactin synthase thioesterase subunit
MISDGVPLLCLPFAGAGPSFFTPWRKLHGAGVDICPVPVPGRERLLGEDPYTDLHAAADGLLPVARRLAGGRPVALFGHCFLGAMLAYELTRRLVADGDLPVAHLFVSASRPPWVSRPLHSDRLADDAFLDLVQTITGYRHPAFEVPEMRELLLPTLRADFQMDETYFPRRGRDLTVPLTAFAAAADRLAAVAEVGEWSRATTGAFRQVTVPGGHMYLADDPRPLLDVIVHTLAGDPGAT